MQYFKNILFLLVSFSYVIPFGFISFPISFRWWWKLSTAESGAAKRVIATRTLLRISYVIGTLCYMIYIPLREFCFVCACMMLFRLPATSPRRRSFRPSTANWRSCRVFVLNMKCLAWCYMNWSGSVCINDGRIRWQSRQMRARFYASSVLESLCTIPLGTLIRVHTK